MRKDVINYPNYTISSFGYIINKTTGKRMSTSLTYDGYPTVRLTKGKKIRRFLLHRLVAIHFIPNPEEKKEVNHKKGIKKDCRASELEWSTRQENASHAKETGLYTFRRKKKKKKLKNRK